MQLARVVLVSVAVAVLGGAATALGFVAENSKFKSFVRFDGQRCVYRRTPGLVYGVVAALLALAALAVATAASGCCRRRRDAPAPVPGRRRTVALRLSSMAWLTAVVAAVFFLYGALMNRSTTRPMSASRWGRRYDGYGYYYGYGCSVLRSGVFTTAAVMSAVATACAIAGYVCFRWAADEPARPPPPGVAMMGQPQWAQPYPPPPASYPPPPPPMAYPAPPQYGNGGYGYGSKQPAGTA